MKNKILENMFLSFYIFLILLLSFSNEYLVFPFKIKNPSIDFKNKQMTADDYIKYNKNNLLAAKVYIGTPPKEMEVYLTMQQFDFYLGKGFCLKNSNSQYNPFSSTSYSKTQTKFISPLFSNGTGSEETFTFYNNLNLTKNSTLNQIEFIYGVASTDFFDLIEPDVNCGYLGLQLSSGSTNFEWNSLIYDLKMKRGINSKQWSIIFYENDNKIKNYDGAFVLGIKEEDYEHLFNINVINYHSENTTIYSLPYIYKTINWEVKFDEIYYSINNNNFSFYKYIQGYFLIDFNYIICNIDYFNSIKENFFNKYIHEGICYIDKNETLKRTKKTDIQKLNIIICDKNRFKDMNKFPTLYFKHVGLNNIFEFNYKDLFQELGDSVVFSIIFDENEAYHWVFGRLFLQNYQFIFDNDAKTITYIKSNKKKDNDIDSKIDNNFGVILKIVLIFVLLVILIIGFFVGFYFGKQFKNKKKRANELDDEYDYIEKKNNERKEGLYEEKDQ